MSLLTNALRACVGRQVTYPAREALSRASIRYYALALEDDNPLYLDDDYARAAGYRSIIAPPTLVCDTCQYAHGRPAATGYLGHEWTLPIDGVRLLRASNEYQLCQPVYPDDWISVRWTLSAIEERRRRNGGSQLFLVSHGEYVNQHGECLAVNRESCVLQPMDPDLAIPATVLATGKASIASEPHPAPAADVAERLPLLERQITNHSIMAYGAATWDWHRLHYDRDYAHAIGLADVVLDGQAYGALLATAAMRWQGPRAFIESLSFKMRSSVHPGETLRVEGEVLSKDQRPDGVRLALVQHIHSGDRLVAEGAIKMHVRDN